MATRTVMNRKLQRLKYLILDSFSAAIAWVLFFSYRKEIVEPQLFGSDVPFLFNSQFWLGVVSITLFWLVLYFLSGYYKNVYRKSRLIELGQTLLQSFVGVLVIFFVAILDDFIPSYKNYYSSISILFVVHFMTTYIFRFVFTTHTVNKIHNRYIGFNTLIVGGGNSAVDMFKNITERKKSGGNLIVGFVNGMDENGYNLKKYIPYLGSYKDLRSVIKSNNIEEVLIAIEQSEQHQILEGIINDLEGVDVLIKVKPNNYDILAGRVKMQSIFDVPLIEIKHDLMPVWQFSLKRVFDVVISLSALFLLSPLFLISTILVKIGSQGPVFFYQERIGIHGALV